MVKNMGNADRLIRLAIVVVIAVLYFTDMITGTLAIVLGILAVVFLATSLIGWCPLYRVLGLSTRSGSDTSKAA